MAKAIKAVRINASQLPAIIETCITAKINLYIEGPAGVGKSEITKQVCKRLDIPLYQHRLADCEPSDLRGLPIVAGHDADGKPLMKFSRPVDIPPSQGQCAWFLDEMNRANRSVMNTVLQATDSNKRVGDHKLSQDMVVIAAGNPTSDSAYDVGELDLALNNRFLHVIVDYNVDAIADYAKASKWAIEVQDFMKMNRGSLFEGTHEPGSPVCTPRSLERLSQLTPALANLERTQALAMIQGCIGAELGSEYFSFIFDLQPVKFAELLTKRGQARLNKLSQDQGYRADLIGLTIDEITEMFKNKATSDITDNQASAVEFLLKTIQAEQAVSAIQSLATKCKGLITHPKIATSTDLRDRLQRVA